MALKPMSRKTPGSKRPVEQYDHKAKKRANNPPVGLVDAKSDAAEGKKTYAYDPHLDPTLAWAGKAERTSFAIPTVSLHVHERIDPRSIVEAVRKKNGRDYEQMSLFSSKAENPPLREAIEFYKHAHNWSNRLVAGDSLLVMNSLLEKEGMAGQVQMIYFDPPYGITYGSNFQPFVNKRDVKDGKDEDLTAKPEMVKAFRDTWLKGQTYHPGPNACWKTTVTTDDGSVPGMEQLAKGDRLVAGDNQLRFKSYLEDFGYTELSNWWDGLGGASEPVYVVQTNPEIVQRALLMTTDPGDLVLDSTCGSGTTAFVAEQWGRRWITCDTSRVALTLAKQRLMTAVFDYYKLAHEAEGVDSGFRYKAVPHITLGSIANNEQPKPETLYDQPLMDNSKTRVTGPFTVEAVPAPMVKSLAEIAGEETAPPMPADESVSRSGETVRQDEWRSELLRAGIRGKGGQMIRFSRVEPLSGTRWLHADAETKLNDDGPDQLREGAAKERQRVVISFGPEHAPLEQKQVERAYEE